VERRKLLIYIVVLAIVALLALPMPASRRMSVAANDTVAPAGNVFSFVSSRMKEAGQVLLGRDSITEENRRLLAEVTSLRMEMRALKDSEKQNYELRKLLDLKKKSKKQLLAADVVAFGDSLGWWRTITINKGTEDGVKPGMAVLSLAGLVGKTMEGVGRKSAQVLLLPEGTSKVSCRIARSGALGILRGMGISSGGSANLELITGVEPYQLEYVDKEAEIMEGDEVYTSGLGGVFPDSLLIGYVKVWTLDQSGLYKRAEVEPACDFSSLQHVLIVTSMQ
jgi:rod shape-determining protein MreC